MAEKKGRSKKPAATPEGRERQLISLAVDLAEKQLTEGTASAAVITHYLKMASKRENLEREILERQSKLLEAKAEAVTSGKENEERTKKALEALKSYGTGNN